MDWIEFNWFVFREIFVKNTRTNEAFREGDRMTRRKLGQTLRRIAAQGIEVFYRGDLAQLVVNEIQKRGFYSNTRR